MSQMSIFDMSDDIKAEDHPPIPECEPWSSVEQCNNAKEVIGFYLSGHPLDDYKYEMHNFAIIDVTQLQDLTPLLARREVRFGGIVSQASFGVSQRTGNPYGSITIEDYVGSYELRLFGDDSVKYRNFCEKGLFVFVQADVTQRTYKKGDGQLAQMPPRLQIRKIILLSDVLNNFAKTINFHIDIERLNDAFCEQLNKMVKQNRGKVQLTVNVEDREHNMSLFMSSPQMLVEPRQFVKLLESMPEVHDIRINAR